MVSLLPYALDMAQDSWSFIGGWKITKVLATNEVANKKLEYKSPTPGVTPRLYLVFIERIGTTRCGSDTA